MTEDNETRLYETAHMALGVLVETADDPLTVTENGVEVPHNARLFARCQAMQFLACYFSRASAPLIASMASVPPA